MGGVIAVEDGANCFKVCYDSGHAPPLLRTCACFVLLLGRDVFFFGSSCRLSKFRCGKLVVTVLVKA